AASPRPPPAAAAPRPPPAAFPLRLIIRPASAGNPPPACEKTQRMLGYFVAMLLLSSVAIATAVSTPYQTLGASIPGSRSRLQSGSAGCTWTIALRRFNSSWIGVHLTLPI